MALFLLWKPRGPSSQQVLGTFKREQGIPGKGRRGIGHTGTLDPFAEGLLLVGTGEALKLLHPLQGLSKIYQAELVLGVPSNTLDDTGELQEGLHLDSSAYQELKSFDFQQFLESKKGVFEQVPPQFSAKHVDGKRAYEWAREGVEKQLSPKRQTLFQSLHLGLDRGPAYGGKAASWVWRFEVQVSAGCYIRAFARDWSEEICGVAGHLKSLRRSAIGPFSLALDETKTQFLGLSDLEKLFDIEKIGVLEAKALGVGAYRASKVSQRPKILVSGDSVPLGWIAAGAERPQRLFLENPLVQEWRRDAGPGL